MTLLFLVNIYSKFLCPNSAFQWLFWRLFSKSLIYFHTVNFILFSHQFKFHYCIHSFPENFPLSISILAQSILWKPLLLLFLWVFLPAAILILRGLKHSVSFQIMLLFLYTVAFCFHTYHVGLFYSWLSQKGRESKQYATC